MAGRLVGPCFYCGQLGRLKLHCSKLPRQQYPLPAISSNSKFVTATGTMCEGKNTKGDISL